MLKRARVIILFLLCICVVQIPSYSKVFFLEAEYYQDSTKQKGLVVGKGEIISSEKPIERVVISDPNVIDIQVLNEKQVFVRATELGITTLLVWEKGLSNPSRFDVSVIPDIDNLTKQLHELDENIIVEYIPATSGSVSTDSMQSQPSPLGGGEAPPGGGGQEGGGEGQAASPFGGGASSSASQATSGRIILKGAVKNAEIIARALQIAGAYVGDQGIRIISQPGGQIVDGLAGEYDISSNSDAGSGGGGGEGGGGGGGTVGFSARDAIRFTSNRYANLSRAVIATTQRGSVISFLTVKDNPQVSVAIRFYEISRTLARSIGFNTTLGGSFLQGATFIGGEALSMTTGLTFSQANIGGFMVGSMDQSSEFEPTFGSLANGAALIQELGQGVTGVIFNPDNGVSAVIQALQQRGEIKTLAEPTLVIANGEPASFLAGGEIPIIRAVITASGAAQEVSYEPFGVRVTLLPTVTTESRIFLQLVPEIREIDNITTALVTGAASTAIRPPAFKTKRTQTQVELESGQAFAISGLLKEENTRNMRKFPGIGDMPIIGSLFRSKSFQKGETELLIVVSPQIVKPTSPDKIAKNLSVPEVPYRDFNFVAPLRPFIEKKDETGPTLEKPINPKRYHEEEPNLQRSMNINNREQFEEVQQSTEEANQPPLMSLASGWRTSETNNHSPVISEEQPETNVDQIKKTLETVIQMKDKEIQEAKNALEVESKAKQIEKEKVLQAEKIAKMKEKELLETKKALLEKSSELNRGRQALPLAGDQRSEMVDGKEVRKEIASSPSPLKTKSWAPRNDTPSQPTVYQPIGKEEKKKLKSMKKQSELASKRQELARLWESETARYQNAKEAMRIARGN